MTCTLVVIGEAHLATLCDHSRSRLSWFWNCFLGARPSSPPPSGGGGWSRSYMPLLARCRPLMIFGPFSSSHVWTIESCLLRLGIEAVASVGRHARTLLLPGLSCLDVSSMSRGGDAHCLPYLLSWHIPGVLQCSSKGHEPAGILSRKLEDLSLQSRPIRSKSTLA